jgi:signal transduction histidine kinase
MSTLGGLAAGLASLPNWLNDSKDPSALDAMLSSWVRSSGWRSVGVVSPTDNGPQLSLFGRPDGVERTTAIPPELPEVLKSLRSGNLTLVWQLPGTAGRLYTLFTPPGRQSGAIWVEKISHEPWSETERYYLRLSARLIERSSALGMHIGPYVDAERLQQRLVDASVIAGRMAHDFDNVLTGIIGFADLSVPLVPAGTQAAKFLAEISKVGQRGIQFTQELHQLSRSGQSKPQPGSVNVAFSKEEQRLKAIWPANVQLINYLPASINPVAMEASPLGIVLGHVLANAMEACTQGGQVTVSARSVELTSADSKNYLGQVHAGGHLEVMIQDTGIGIKPEHRAKLFSEPFFTTKIRHRGLGLAIVYRTLSAHRGGVRIEPETASRTGTVARVVIPFSAVRPAISPSPSVVMATTS